MQRALAACLMLSFGAAPLGIFFSLRRMTLLGDAMSHAILPGVAVAFILAGLSVWPMTLGGFAAGLAVSMAALFLSRTTLMKEDSSFTFIYLLCIAMGVIMISIKGSNVDLLHILFGNILAMNNESLLLTFAANAVTLLALAVFYRAFVIDCFDPDFLSVARGGRSKISFVFYFLLMLNLIASFQALGSLMALGLMILPSLTARFWTRNIDPMLPLSMLISALSSWLGLSLSFALNIPSGPSVVLVAGAFCCLSLVFGTQGSLRKHYWP